MRVMPHKVAATKIFATVQNNDDASELRRVIPKQGLSKRFMKGK